MLGQILVPDFAQRTGNIQSLDCDIGARGVTEEPLEGKWMMDPCWSEGRGRDMILEHSGPTDMQFLQAREGGTTGMSGKQLVHLQIFNDSFMQIDGL